MIPINELQYYNWRSLAFGIPPFTLNEVQVGDKVFVRYTDEQGMYEVIETIGEPRHSCKTYMEYIMELEDKKEMI